MNLITSTRVVIEEENLLVQKKISKFEKMFESFCGSITLLHLVETNLNVF